MDAPPPSTPPSTVPVAPPGFTLPWRSSLRTNHQHPLLTEAECEIFKLKSNSQLVKAWIFFYRFCLKDPLTFALVKSGARPWYSFDPHYDEKWDFSFADISEDYDRMMLYAGPDEFRKMFDAFTFFCFKCEGFEIVQTAAMGLGIHTTRKITLEVLSSKLCGFLEFIPKTHFRQLQRLHYKSLYSFDYEDPEDLNSGNKRPRTKTYYFILFGPLAICNSDNDVSVRFFNFDDRDGTLLIWKMTYHMVDEDTENDIESRTCFKTSDSLTIEDAVITPGRDSYCTFGVESMSALKHPYIETNAETGSRKKVEFYVKVVLHHRNTTVFRQFEYEKGEEVFVKYSLTDALI